MIITADESLIRQIQNSSNASLFKSIIIDSKDDGGELSCASVIRKDLSRARFTEEVFFPIEICGNTFSTSEEHQKWDFDLCGLWRSGPWLQLWCDYVRKLQSLLSP